MPGVGRDRSRAVVAVTPRKLLYRGPSLAELQNSYAKQHRVDTEAPLVSRSTIEVDAPIWSVWNVLCDVEAWPRWAPRVELLSKTAVRPDEPFTWKLNGVTIVATFAVVSAPTELSWTGRFFAYRAVDRNLLEPLSMNRTRVTFEESLAGPLLPLFYRSSQLRANHDRWLGSLKTFTESRSGP
jgi:uncharacterized membrane protein